MINIARKLFLIIIVALGIASLIATPAPLPRPSELIVKTRNPLGPPVYYNSLFKGNNSTHILRDNAACKGDKISVGWDILNSRTAILTSLPKTVLSPNFDQRAVTAQDSQEVTISDEVNLILASEATYKQTIKLLPKEICTAFPIVIVGKYLGSFKQTSPESKVLERYLYIYWQNYSNNETYPVNAKIFETEPETTREFDYATSLACELQTSSHKISCSTRGQNKLTMIITVTDSGLKGEYSNPKPSSRNPILDSIAGSGSFSFSKKSSP